MSVREYARFGYESNRSVYKLKFIKKIKEMRKSKHKLNAVTIYSYGRSYLISNRTNMVPYRKKTEIKNYRIK